MWCDEHLMLFLDGAVWSNRQGWPSVWQHLLWDQIASIMRQIRSILDIAYIKKVRGCLVLLCLCRDKWIDTTISLYQVAHYEKSVWWFCCSPLMWKRFLFISHVESVIIAICSAAWPLQLPPGCFSLYVITEFVLFHNLTYRGAKWWRGLYKSVMKWC